MSWLRAPMTWWWTLSVAAGALVGYYALGGDTLAGAVYWDVAIGVVLLMAAARAATLVRHRAAWVLVVGGQLAFLVGDLIWLVLERALESEASPNVGDAAYLSGYLLIGAGAVLFVPRSRTIANIGALVDGVIVAVAAGVLVWVFFVEPTTSSGATGMAAVVGTAYPVGDLVLIALGAQAAMRVRWSASSLLLVGSMVALLAGDLWYLELSQRETYTAGHPVDALWFISYAIAAAAVLHPSAERLEMTPAAGTGRGISLGRVAFLAGVSILPPLAMALETESGTTVALTIGTIALFLLVVTRLAMVAQELQESRTQLEHDATHDPLTGLGNRVLYTERVRQAIHASVATPARTAVLCIDVDDFKTVNDSLGHAAGDRMLQEIGNRLRRVVRRADSVARLGGDEFAVLVCDEPADAALEVADRLLAEIARPIALDTGTYTQTTASIGIAFGAPGESVESLLRDADVAMYLAKNHGKGRWEVYRPGMRQNVVDRFELRTDLMHALERDQLFLHYQPIVEVDSGRVSGIEALVRWQHPIKGRIDPGRFIGLAEETGLIVPIGRWILCQACRQAQELDPSPQGPRVAVNVSAVQLRSPDLVTDVREALDTSGLAPHRLLLELTESAMIDDYGSAAARLDEIRLMGVRIALDDFGAGYTSLRQLQSFPVDVVKLDQSFINTTMAHDVGVLNGLITMANSLGLETVGEGIEELAQLSRLREARCMHAQGFLFSRPVPVDELAAALAAAGDAASEPDA